MAGTGGKPAKRRRRETEEQRRLRQENDRSRGKTRIHLGPAFSEWRKLRETTGHKNDPEFALYLIESYLRTNSGNRPEQPVSDGSSSAETSVRLEHPPTIRSPTEAERESCAASSVNSSENGKESRYKNVACQTFRIEDEKTTSGVSEHEDSRDTQDKDEDEDFSTSIRVGDVRSLADLGSYLQTKTENPPEQPVSDGSSSAETSVRLEHLPTISSPTEAERESCAASSVRSSENGKESQDKNAACLRLRIEDEQTTSSVSEHNDSRDTQDKDEDEEFSTSIRVGDGHYQVDLGSASEFVVDEECILQLFKICRKCNRKCSVTKETKGLKLVVYQSCSFCNVCYKWTNLPDNDYVISGQNAVNGRTNSAELPGRNTN